MKKKYLLLAILVSCMHIVFAQSDYRVVFDLTSKDSLDHKAVLRWVTEVAKASPDAKLEVVMYGQGVNMVTKNRTVVEEAIKKLVGNKNISFKVCEVALKNQGISKDQLLPGIETVPDGIYEIIKKQREGWGYIKAVH